MKKLFFLLTILVSLAGFSQTNKVDLEAVSIDPVSPIVNKGEPVSVRAIFRNNGPEAIPPGQAKARITFSNTYLSLPRNKGVIESIHWQLVSIKRKAKGKVKLVFRNSSAMNPGDDGSCIFYVKGKKYTDVTGCVITLSMTLTDKAADIDTKNQSTSNSIIVLKK
jgi:hypothetical protein